MLSIRFLPGTSDTALREGCAEVASLMTDDDDDNDDDQNDVDAAGRWESVQMQV